MEYCWAIWPLSLINLTADPRRGQLTQDIDISKTLCHLVGIRVCGTDHYPSAVDILQVLLILTQQRDQEERMTPQQIQV